MAMKGYFAFPKVSELQEPLHQIIQCPIQDTHWGGGAPEMESLCSTSPADWARKRTDNYIVIFSTIEGKVWVWWGKYYYKIQNLHKTTIKEECVMKRMESTFDNALTVLSSTSEGFKQSPRRRVVSSTSFYSPTTQHLTLLPKPTCETVLTSSQCPVTILA